MLFSELYGAYYTTVATILKEAVAHPVTNEQLRKIVEKHAFGESIISIPAALKEGRWQLLKADGTTPLKNAPALPLTLLQKRWLKAVACNPKIKLFGDIDFGLDDVEPLFLPTDVIIFDKYSDGDDYTNEAYIKNFRLILDAMRNKYPLFIKMLGGKGKPVRMTVYPKYLEYSEKDDKFRLIGVGSRSVSTINLARIIRCKPSDRHFEINHGKQPLAKPGSVTFELKDERNALERALLHFAHFEKTAERLDGDKYIITVHYDKEDEIEIVIRVLSFGPMIKVTAPQHFIELIKQRLINQKSCGH